MCYIERFSTKCRKTKTKVNTLTNHSRHKQHNEPIRTRNICNQSQERENASEGLTIGFGFTPDWSRKWREISQPTTERTEAKPKKTQNPLTINIKPL